MKRIRDGGQKGLLFWIQAINVPQAHAQILMLEG